ncbi:PAP1-domain-containing protein [Aaosphaeria arxii CBS 175.79]|uniref:PAP1-domain-containing protein n=1 Tax=Aaosphaeria arxii CBS 175.79 TaxID=1450172 RepID=A0A6A5Y843_9PLEO|nr:PAP1-domain-containing protein [Aaosphaeria arxii CBS 175.79]KAF2020980.1 PAP1-domain-containing protein [Aaosphaeria arxii CBS 175.79]
MAGTSTNDFGQNGAPFYLDPNQQDLLLAALASNNPDPSNLFSTNDAKTQQSLNGSQFPYPIDGGIDPNYFTSPQQSTPANNFSSNNANIEESPFVDYLDGDTSFDFENGDSELMIGDLPGDSPESSEKRKSPEDDAEDPDGGGKRREPEDKQAKKPGRKPLTSEPTTKRKAQNRAAQRAFRERKEKHLKDLETKVSELEQASDAANHENGLLRGQVQRLQMELREYRKRLSLNSTGVNRTPPMAGGFSSLLGNNNNANSHSSSASGNFQFEFPRFGGLPGSHILDNGPLAKSSKSSVPSPAAPNRHNSNGSSLSPGSQSVSSNAASPDKNGKSFNSAPRAGSLNSISNGNDYLSHNSSRRNTNASTNQSRVFQFNSGSSTNSDSPSNSSTSHAGQNSSCDTSPEPSHNSPKNPVDTITEGYVCHGNSEGEITFCEKLNMACGNPRNPVPRTMSHSDVKSPPAVPTKTPVPDVQGFDFFANQNGGQFDPTLFGDYRDTQNAIVGDGDFTNGFFNDAFPITDFGSPFHFGDTPAIQKPNPLEEIERLQDGVDDEVVPGEDVSQMLNCHKIWDKLSNRSDFKDGTIDIDNLCSELRSKARCSESGVVVDHKDVEAALKRLPEQM